MLHSDNEFHNTTKLSLEPRPRHYKDRLSLTVYVSVNAGVGARHEN